MRALFAQLRSIFGYTPTVSRWNVAARIKQRKAEGTRAATVEKTKATAIKIAPFAAAMAAIGGFAAWVSRPARRAKIAETTRSIRGRARGVASKITRSGPATDVDDDLLVDRVRSMIGPVERVLDIPHVNVMAHDGFIQVHGAIDTRANAAVLEKAIAGVPGVRGVESHLHIGLTDADTRPSEGRRLRTLKMGTIKRAEVRTPVVKG